MRKPIGISSCLLGIKCRFDGGDCEIPGIHKSTVNWIPVCPEEAGGLPTPRIPSELTNPAEIILERNSGVINSSGEDVSHYFIQGAKAALSDVTSAGCEKVILKSYSPSCGYGEIYDGHFTGKLKRRDGIFAHLCVAAGLKVISSDHVESVKSLEILL